MEDLTKKKQEEEDAGLAETARELGLKAAAKKLDRRSRRWVQFWLTSEEYIELSTLMARRSWTKQEFLSSVVKNLLQKEKEQENEQH